MRAQLSVCHFRSRTSLPRSMQRPQLMRMRQQSARLAAHLLQPPPYCRHCRLTAAQGPVTSSSVRLRQTRNSAQ